MARNRQPWFVPDFGDNWQWSVALAVRISRLGKCIQPKFASRYYDARTLLWLPSYFKPTGPTVEPVHGRSCHCRRLDAADRKHYEYQRHHVRHGQISGFDSFLLQKRSKIVTLKPEI